MNPTPNSKRKTPPPGALGWDGFLETENDLPRQQVDIFKPGKLIGEKGTALIFNQASKLTEGVLNVGKVVKAELPDAATDLWKQIIGAETTPKSPEANQQKEQEKIEDQVRFARFNEALRSPIKQAVQAAKVGDQIVGVEELLKLAGLSADLQIIGEVSEYTQASAEKALIDRQKEQERAAAKQNILAVATRRAGPNLDLNKQEGNSMVANAITSAG